MNENGAVLHTQARSRTEWVFRTLREEILLCHIPPNSVLTEPELVNRFGVSKTPVREALGRLGAEGLVDVIPNKGYLVTPFSMRDLRELFELRRILESGAAERAAILAGTSDLTESDLTEVERTLDPLVNVSDRKEFLQLNLEFHIAVARLSKNEKLVRQVVSVNEMLQRAVALNVRQGERDLHADEHAEITAEIRAGNGPGARLAMSKHIELTYQRILGQLARL